MSLYPRGYKIYEPLDPMKPDLSKDNLVKTFVEGVDYQIGDSSVSFDETNINSTFLEGGLTQYRYFVPYDDENIGTPSNVFSLLNLMPPTNVTLSSVEYDELSVSFTSAEYASGYKYSLREVLTGNVVEGVLPLNHSLIGLKSDTLYEIKLTSTNVDGLQTEWSNASQISTLKLFILSSVTTDNGVYLEWQHNDNIPITRFDLINNDDGSVMYSGLNTFYNLPSPVSVHNNLVKVFYTDGKTRSTRVLTSVVSKGLSSIIQFGQNTIRDSKENAFHEKIVIYHEDSNIIKYKTSYYIDYHRNALYPKNSFTKDITSLGYYKLSLKNDMKDNLVFRQGSSKNDSFIRKSDTQFFKGFVNLAPIKSSVNNNLIDVRKVNLDLKTDFRAILPFKPMMTRDNLKSSFIYDNIIVQNEKRAITPKFWISNTRTTPYGLKLPYFNTMKTNVARGRQKIYNPIKPFDVDHVDIIFNATISNIDVQSQINKVRILCLGDSITAGAPSYDPQYGGTVWVSDLITGKTKTRNVIESQYPYWLQTRLGLDDFEVVNEGSGRRTSAEVLYHVPRQMEQYKPEYVIVMIGTNDIFSAQDSGATNLANVVEKTLLNIRNTVDTIKSYNGIPILGTQLPRNSIVPQEAKNALRSLNAGIKNLGIEYGMDIIDWYNEFVQKDSSGIENGVLRYDLTVDDTHPSVVGYKKMAFTINLGIFNSFRASLRLFGEMSGQDVNYDKEEAKIQPDPYTLKYSIRFPELRRLQRYVFSKYIKNTGNSWGLFTIRLNDNEDICEVWDEKNKVWTDYLVGQLAPNQIMELRMRYILPATGVTKVVDFNIDYIVKR